jgi:hypothetical protein
VHNWRARDVSSPAAREPFEAAKACPAEAVAQLGEGGRRERDLGDRRQPISDEALQTAESGAFEVGRVALGEEHAELESVVEAQLAELAAASSAARRFFVATARVTRP